MQKYKWIVVDTFYIMEVGGPSFKARVLVMNKGKEKLRILTSNLGG